MSQSVFIVNTRFYMFGKYSINMIVKKRELGRGLTLKYDCKYAYCIHQIEKQEIFMIQLPSYKLEIFRSFCTGL